MSRHTFALFFLSFFLSIPIQLSRPCRHPSIRTLCERYSLGARWVFSFSRCCYLVIDLSSRLFGVGVGPQDLVAVTWTRRSSSAVRIKTLYATARIALLLLRNGSYTSPLTHSRWRSTASFLATATTARFLAFFPPRSASFSPHLRRSLSSPKGPRM